MKNIALFCDGTWQNLDQKFPTNVTRLARAVAQTGPDHHAQLVYYDNGVGVGNGVLDESQRLIGGAFGEGLDDKIARAYEFLCLNYAPGDRIFIFGFSRGAYTARSIAGLLRRVWVLRRENVGLIGAAMEIYRNHSSDAVETKIFRRNNCWDLRPFTDPRDADPVASSAALAQQGEESGVTYLGVWDTVGSLGIPATLPFASHLNDRYRFHDQNLSRFVLSARHAVAIDERRKTFEPTLWDNIDVLNTNANAAALDYPERPYQQRWFPGHHSSVGGGEDDGGVSIPPLLWIAEGAARAGLVFDRELIDLYRGAADPTAKFPDTPRSFGSLVIAITGLADRDGPATLDEVSDAARTRWDKLPDYRPVPLRHTLGAPGQD